MRTAVTFALMLAAATLSSCSMPSSDTISLPLQANGYIGLTDFSGFAKSPGTNAGETVWTSPELAAPIDWNELIVSWNAPPATALKVEARAFADGWSSRFYNLGEWSFDPAKHPSRSVNGQKDANGDVQTDTLVLQRLARRVQLRLTLRRLDDRRGPALKFLGLSFLNNTLQPPPRPPNKAAWGRTLPVPERAQLAYADGRDWCSPTSVSMVLGYWAATRRRPELNVDVPEAARRIHDPSWGGTGNWVFNTAFAGSFEGMRAYVTRFSDLSEVEEWIAAGFPVVLSVSFDLLNGRAKDQGTGHLVVCVGFNESGDVIVNDPWTPKDKLREVRRVYSRQDVIRAWARSRNAVYLIYPEAATIPLKRSRVQADVPMSTHR